MSRCGVFGIVGMLFAFYVFIEIVASRMVQTDTFAHANTFDNSIVCFFFAVILTRHVSSHLSDTSEYSKYANIRYDRRREKKSKIFKAFCSFHNQVNEYSCIFSFAPVNLCVPFVKTCVQCRFEIQTEVKSK